MTRDEVAARTPVDTDESAGLARLLAGRFSCRAFRPDPVPRPVIERMLSMAQLTASWCNSQAWQVAVTEGEGTRRFREALFAHASSQPPDSPAQYDFPGPRYSGVYLERRREVGWQLYESVGVARGDRGGAARQALENFRLFGAPHVAIISADRDLGVYGAIDCGAYVTSFVLAAQSLGLASIPQAALAHHAPFVRRHFGLPEERSVVCGISFGYQEGAHAANRFRTRRADLARVVDWVSA
jgi:nitroreductase